MGRSSRGFKWNLLLLRVGHCGWVGDCVCVWWWRQGPGGQLSRGGIAGSALIPRPPTPHPHTHPQGPKQRKAVDRRASKGRKIRYHVHEKLVNFMTPVDLEAPQFAAQLFGNLFGGVRAGR